MKSQLSLSDFVYSWPWRRARTLEKTLKKAECEAAITCLRSGSIISTHLTADFYMREDKYDRNSVSSFSLLNFSFKTFFLLPLQEIIYLLKLLTLSAITSDLPGVKYVIYYFLCLVALWHRRTFPLVLNRVFIFTIYMENV
jgi:hypothetical protein